MVKRIAAFLIFLVICFHAMSACAENRFVVVDVGEGQAILLQNGEYAILIDTGHFGKSHKLLEVLESFSIKSIEKVFLTHLHLDHASGIYTVMNKYPHAKIYESGHRLDFHPMRDGYRWITEQLDSGAWEVERSLQDDTFYWRGFNLEVLWPRAPSGKNLNDQSLVLKISLGNSIIMIMGDVGISIEKILLQENRMPRYIDVLVVGHHGSAATTSPELLQQLTPQNAVISTNKNNIRGYPDAEVVGRLKSFGIKVHKTAEHGNFVWNFPSNDEADVSQVE